MLLIRFVKPGWIVAPAAVLALAVLTAACDSTTTVVTSPDAGGIAVNGTGTVIVTPDIAQLSLGVEVRGVSVADARRGAANALEAVRTSLRRNGVEERDIKTQGLNIRPEYGTKPIAQPVPVRPGAPTQPLAPPNGSGGGNGQAVIVGYVVTNTVSVKVRNLDSASKVLDDAVEAGGDDVRVNGISFGVDKPEQYLAEARELAVKDARQRAEELAKLAGVDLGQPRSINESFGGSIPFEARALAAPATGGDSPTPINPGESAVSMQVSIVYALR